MSQKWIMIQHKNGRSLPVHIEQQPENRSLRVRIEGLSERHRLIVQISVCGVELFTSKLTSNDIAISYLMHNWYDIERQYNKFQRDLQDLKHVYYHGNRYKIELVNSPTEAIAFTHDSVCLHGFFPNMGTALALWRSWYATKAREELPQLFWKFHAETKIPELEQRGLIISGLKSSWAKISPHRKIFLARHLINLPLSLQQFIMVHQMCALHSLSNAQIISELLLPLIPDYQERIKQLKNWKLNEYIGAFLTDS